MWLFSLDLLSVVLPAMFADLRINKRLQQILHKTDRKDSSETLYAKIILIRYFWLFRKASGSYNYFVFPLIKYYPVKC